jgi:hypothetical protein
MLKEGIDSSENIQLWTMVLLGIKLFLRADELVTMKLENFRPECARIDKKNKRIESIVLKVRGKSDLDWVSLTLWRDDQNPEFCPIRALMVYLAKANLKDGYLFPKVQHVSANFSVKEPQSYDVHNTYEQFLHSLRVS